MIPFERFSLSNGLTVIHHHDTSTPMMAMNILYKVGARDEHPDKTGFAHLFEHLMFGGSMHIDSYDEPLQRAGGENNAFTNNDFTDYYLQLPAQNAETGFWLESDRMYGLAFSEKSLDVQKHVVIEEFRQRYLNQPFGDVWLHLRPLAYKVHPYQWATIGKDISHIEQATMDDVKSFFQKYYAPDNAILVVAGNISIERTRELCKKWFEEIPAEKIVRNSYPKEPGQNQKRTLTLERNVPCDSIYLAFHCCSRHDNEFYATDLMADILSLGKSSRLHQSLVKEQKLFSEIAAYMSGDLDKGLFVIEGKMMHGVKMDAAENAIRNELDKLIRDHVAVTELEKVKQKFESSVVFSEMNIANKALSLAYCEMLGDAGLVNQTLDRYRSVTKDEIMKIAEQIFKESNCSALYYKAVQN